MSEENVEIVRVAIDALNRGDLDGLLDHAAPDFEVDYSRSVGTQPGVYRSDQLRTFWDGFAAFWESLRFEAGEFIEAGDHVVTPITTHARGRGGIEVQARPAWVWTFRDGALVRACMYQEREEALKATGLSE